MSRLPWLAILSMASCASIGPADLQAAPCTMDTHCREGEICFPEGCGDPGRNLLVEVTPFSSTIPTQDVAVPFLASTQLLSLNPGTPLKLSLQSTTPDRLAPPVPYIAPVRVQLAGQSELIPGVERSYEALLGNALNDKLSLLVADGLYSVQLTAVDPAIPPEVLSNVSVRAGRSTEARVVFSAPETALGISGRLLQWIDPTNVERAVTTATMQLQAYDPNSGRPLSQKTLASSGLAGSTGDFSLRLHPDAASLSELELRANPTAYGAPVPSKTFRLKRPLPTFVRLELGYETADPLPASGQVIDGSGRPVEGALVFLSGMVEGGGIFYSRTAITDAQGAFQVELLASAPGERYVVRIFAPSHSPASSVVERTELRIDAGTARLIPAVFRCPDKIPLVGTLVRHDGRPAGDVRVTATPVDGIDGLDAPLETIEGVTDATGVLSMSLEPGAYRLDIQPSDDNPSWSIFVRPERAPGAQDGRYTPVELGEVRLPRGRTVSGTVLFPPGGPTSRAGVRFFRTTLLEGRRTAVLLGETSTDATGDYVIVLPVR